MNRLTTQITIEQQSLSDPNDYNERTPGWSELATGVWADIDPLSGRQLDFARSFSHTVTHSILIRYRAGMSSTMRARKGDRVFNINAILNQDIKGDFKERNIWLMLVCTESVTDQTPESIEVGWNTLSEGSWNSME